MPLISCLIINYNNNSSDWPNYYTLQVLASPQVCSYLMHILIYMHRCGLTANIQYHACMCVPVYVIILLIHTYIGPPSPINVFPVRDSNICDTTISGLSWTPSIGDPVCGAISYDVMV